jgi:hypothetical protein
MSNALWADQHHVLLGGRVTDAAVADDLSLLARLLKHDELHAATFSRYAVSLE